MKNQFTDLKIYLLNTTALGVTFSNVNLFLKLLLVLTTLGYTSHKWFILYKNSKNNKNPKQ